MSTPDLNLLITLDVLLAEGSVAGAARRLRLSPSAMSRALARLREALAQQDVAGASVRVRWTVGEEDRSAVDRDAIQRMLGGFLHYGLVAIGRPSVSGVSGCGVCPVRGVAGGFMCHCLTVRAAWVQGSGIAWGLSAPEWGEFSCRTLSFGGCK